MNKLLIIFLAIYCLFLSTNAKVTELLEVNSKGIVDANWKLVNSYLTDNTFTEEVKQYFIHEVEGDPQPLFFGKDCRDKEFLSVNKKDTQINNESYIGTTFELPAGVQAIKISSTVRVADYFRNEDPFTIEVYIQNSLVWQISSNNLLKDLCNEAENYNGHVRKDVIISLYTLETAKFTIRLVGEYEWGIRNIELSYLDDYYEEGVIEQKLLNYFFANDKFTCPQYLVLQFVNNYVPKYFEDLQVTFDALTQIVSMLQENISKYHSSFLQLQNKNNKVNLIQTSQFKSQLLQVKNSLKNQVGEESIKSQIAAITALIEEANSGKSEKSTVELYNEIIEKVEALKGKFSTIIERLELYQNALVELEATCVKI